MTSNNRSECSSSKFSVESEYDVVCIGFGPSALSLAIALHEQRQPLRVLFLERQPRFSWRGEKFPDSSSSMRTTLLQDLVAQRNPISKFTFINYLWSTENLVSFTNLGLTHPPRKVFAQYLHWCAKHIEELGWVQYGQEARGIDPINGSGRAIDSWRVNVKDTVTGEFTSVLADKIVVAVGTQPKLPSGLDGVGAEGRIFHSSDFLKCVPKLVEWPAQTLDVAIFGENDEAVEIFEHCRGLQWKGNATLFAGDVALRQTDENPFIGTLIANKDGLPFEHRDYRVSKQPSIKQNALESLYLKQYAQLIKKPNPDTHRFQVRTSCGVVGASQVDASNQLVLELRNHLTGSSELSKPVDILFVASGYDRKVQAKLLEPLGGLGDSRDGQISVDGEYRVTFRRDAVAQTAAVWVLDAFESSSDNAFSYMAVRTNKIITSLLENQKLRNKQQSAANHNFEERAVL